ncbi:hypothetical protein SAMN04487895_12627 [Paenibacillus sophorae]|uniref:Uncharacterized protein n=1 Tax=Paenibacillus sophorae TaxID=1333845 RepID=A0A1H8VND7_9BACL|nr:hypothetical protein [Paenibacillus sophorae]QWU17593.1 hypothetical protein KP014_10890 [Paenibacillus sophorae]SEP16972.1 hypothetical protein SAMN04487895_12627 [Paenibacillus sophorae]
MTVRTKARGGSRKFRPRLAEGGWHQLQPLAALALLVALLVPAACSPPKPPAEAAVSEAGGGAAAPDPFTAVAWVNGEPVAYGEFRTRMLELRGEVVAETAKGGTDPAAKSFWTSDIGGRTPLGLLKEKTLDLLVRVKVQQIAAKEAGIAEDIGYEAFLSRLDAENRTRSSRLRRGEVIYGPRQYSEQAYYRYTLANLELALRQQLAEEEGDHSGKPLDDKRYESWLNRQAANAVVQVNPSMYDKLSAE